jgi:hypothetical protein
VLSVFEAQDFETSREMLQCALDRYKLADETITAYHKLLDLKKENSHVRSAASRSNVA